MNSARRMRDVLIEAIYQQMKKDKKLFFVSADFGSPKLDQVRRDFSDRFINVGIAEQNLINVGVGLALEGFTVYCYAIAPFISMRAYEQIRNNISLLSHGRELNINLVGVGAGLSYDVSGPSHHCIEDIAALRVFPNIMLYSPSDCVLVEEIAKSTFNNNKPKYLRLDGKPLPSIYDPAKMDFFKDGFFELVSGKDVCLLSTGYMTHTALKAAKILKKEGISAGVVDVFLLKPFPEKEIVEVLNKYDSIISIEEGFIKKGGLDTIISQISEIRSKKLLGIGFDDRYVFEVGDRTYLHKKCQLDEISIVERTKLFLKGDKG